MKKVTIKTGKRSWNMTVSRVAPRGLILVSSSGKEYLLWAKGAIMMRHADVPRVYQWSVTNVEEVQAQLPTLSTICSSRQNRDRDVSTVHSAVVAAYQGLAPKAGEWVSLADLRGRLTDWSRSEVDMAIVAMDDAGVASLTCNEDGCSITPAEHEAAITPGVTPMHYIRMAA